MILKVEGYLFARLLRRAKEIKKVKVIPLIEGGWHRHYIWIAEIDKKIIIWTDDPTNYSGTGRSMLHTIIAVLNQRGIKAQKVGEIPYSIYHTMLVASYKANEQKMFLISIKNADDILKYFQKDSRLEFPHYSDVVIATSPVDGRTLCFFYNPSKSFVFIAKEKEQIMNFLKFSQRIRIIKEIKQLKDENVFLNLYSLISAFVQQEMRDINKIRDIYEV